MVIKLFQNLADIILEFVWIKNLIFKIGFRQSFKIYDYVFIL